jgi:hypothetical protein
MAKHAKRHVFQVPDGAMIPRDHFPFEKFYPDRWDNSRPEVKLLCERYGIPPTEARPGLIGAVGRGEINWKRLALMLAFKHEPSWKHKKTPGAKKKDLRDFMLILDVEHLQANGFNLSSNASAIRALVSSSPRWKGKNKGRLETALGDAKKDLEVLATLENWREWAHASGVNLWEYMNQQFPHPVTTWAAEHERWLKSAPRLASRK